MRSLPHPVLQHDVDLRPSSLPNRRRWLSLAAASCTVALGAGPAWANAPASLPLSTLVNRAGRMRALSQRLSKAYAQSTMGVAVERSQLILNQSAALVRSSLLELRVGARGNEGLAAAVAAVDAETQTLLGIVEAPVQRTRLVEVSSTADRMLQAADAATKAFEATGRGSSARVVNIAGRQRMLSQRAARGYFLAVAGQPQGRAQMEQAAGEFRTALQTLRELPLNTPAIAQQLELAGPQWTLYESALRSAPAPDSLINVATASERLFEVMDRLTGLYDEALKTLI